MVSKVRSLVVVVIVFMSAFCLTSVTLPLGVRATTLYVGGTGPGNYTTIQSAIDDAIAGDTVYVFKGTYKELLEVDKPLSLVGEDREQTVINGMGLGNVINVTSDWVNITGFKVTGAKSGNYGAVNVFFVQHCSVANNNVSSNEDHSIYLRQSNNTTILNNVLWGNSNGIHLWASNGNSVIGNMVSLTNAAGIDVYDSNNNTVTDNFASGNSRGIALWWGATSNVVVNNTATGNEHEGIYLYHVHSNEVASNIAISNSRGIDIEYSDNNTATGNYVWNNQDGIALRLDSESNTVANNTVVSSNRRGINLEGSNNNTIHHNNIINNSQQAYDDRNTNQWDDGYPSGGNYWSDYIGPDVMNGPNQDILGSDGMGDTPYVIDADSEDRYPLVDFVPSPPSAPLNLSAFPGDQQIFLTWDPPYFNGTSPITNYRIYRGTTTGSEVFYVQVGNVLNYLDFGVTNGQTYCYRVSAINAVGEGPMSNEACAIPSTTPGPPMGLNAAAGDREIALNWTPPGSDGGLAITNYRIYRGNSSGAEVFLTEVGNVNNYVDANLLVGQTYYYQVSAVNPNGEGPLSNEANATPSIAPGSPRLLQAELSGMSKESVRISWSLSNDDGTGQGSVIGYAIYRNSTYDVFGTDYQQVAFLLNGTAEYTDLLVGEGDANNYFYRVCAVDFNNLTNCSSNQAGKFTRSLSNGPNLVSIPLIQFDENIETVLQTLKWNKAWTYDSSIQKWKSHTTFKAYKGDLNEVNVSMGVWVNVTEQSNLTVAGLVPSTTSVYLHVGWNLVGFPSFNATYTVSDLKASVRVERIEGFDASTPPYFLRAMTDGEVLQAGYGHWIKVANETIWVVASS